MTTYLLDANLLIALTIAEHEHHEPAAVWASTIEKFAVCPVVEGALVRFLVRIGETVDGARRVLQAVHARAGCEFWDDSLSYVDVDLDGVRGHRQVTDAYLISLVRSHRAAMMATFDAGLAQRAPQHAMLLA